MNRAQNVLRGRLAAAVRHNPEDADRLRSALKVSRAEDYIANLLADPTPPMADRRRLASLLTGDE